MAFDMFPDLKTKPLFRNERTIYSCQRSQKIFPFKKRKFFDQSTLPTFDGAFHCEDIFNSSNKRTNGNNMVSATESSSSVTSQHASLDSRDYNVKLSIKSFKVPELFIEIPTTTTVGSLKRIVMEAITAILGDGLHVGIFSKERRHAKMMLPPHTKNPSNLPFSAPGGITRHTTFLMLQAGTSHAFSIPAETNFNSSVGSDLGAVCSLAKASTADKMSDSRALVPVPAIGRRPFTVAEVEALVQAIERLGTGRWRDVKLHAFDKANHQTHIDLKDKWKTLVHTARISPQQRRVELVPQEVLDKVLAAQAYWSYRRQLVKAEV
uniref:Uncharacterized protein n=1 Tax=Populus alba TaxID=43335 RepID=A0A4U5QHS5_POPAL|nr:hypothetical protein D5086_0000091610 [Populus alba]